AQAASHDLVRRQTGDGRVVEGDRAAVARQEPADHVEERGLAGSVGADESGDLAPGDLDADVRQCGEAAKALADVLDPEDRVYGQGTSFPSFHCTRTISLRTTSPGCSHETLPLMVSM